VPSTSLPSRLAFRLLGKDVEGTPTDANLTSSQSDDYPKEA